MTEPAEEAGRLSAITPRRPVPSADHRERRPAPGRPFGRIEPTILDESMRRADLIWTLENLDFRRGVFADNRQLATIVVDRGVRDFLLRAIRRRVVSRR